MYNILVCDDEKDIVSALKIYLTSDGYRVYEAYDGQEAVDIIRNEDIQLVLMDVMMPKMDGIQAMVKIREISNVPVILLTVLLEEEKPYVLLMDEPEISLHVEWQQKLVDNIRMLNPHAQIILTTHSPAVIMNGWLDAVTDVADIVVDDGTETV